MNDFFTKFMQMNNILIILDSNASKYTILELSKSVLKVLLGGLVVNYIKQKERRSL